MVRHQYRHERLVIAALLVGMVAIAVMPCECTSPNGHLVTEQYTVQPGDTLDAISYKYMERSTARRDVREFREGIIEANWELLKDRYPYAAIRNYWVAD